MTELYTFHLNLEHNFMHNLMQYCIISLDLLVPGACDVNDFQLELHQIWALSVSAL